MASLITGQGTESVTASETVVDLGGGTQLTIVSAGPLAINFEIEDATTATVVFDATDFTLASGESIVIDLKKGHSMALIASGAGPTTIKWICINSGHRSSK